MGHLHNAETEASRELLAAQEQLDRNPSERQIHHAQTEQKDSERQKDSEDLEGFGRKQKEATFGGSLSSPSLNTRLPLRIFCQRAASLSIEAAAESEGRWKSVTWEFTRLCKTHPKLMTLTADEAFESIPWRLTDFGDEEQMQFLVEWNSVRHLPGTAALDWAASMARARPLFSTRKRFDTYNRFVSLAGWLQILVGSEGSIFLPTRKVAEVLGMKSHVQVATLCKLAVADRLLEMVERHTAKRATRYRFAVERYEVLRQWQS
jgi:hypothetical protein